MSLDVNVTVKGEMVNQSENKQKETPQKTKTKTPMIRIDKKGRILKSEILDAITLMSVGTLQVLTLFNFLMIISFIN